MPKLHPTKNDLPADVRERMVQLLNQNVLDTFDLYSQVKHAHWNVKGREFYQLHELFDELAARLLEHIDMMAERATALGGTAVGTVRTAAAGSRLPEYPPDITEGLRHVDALSDRYARLAANVRLAIDESNRSGDADSADLFTEVSRDVDKDLWFLEAHLQK